MGARTGNPSDPNLPITKPFDGSNANGDAWMVGMSSDGRRVLFASAATNLYPPGTSQPGASLQLWDARVGKPIAVAQSVVLPIDRFATQLGALSDDGSTAAFAVGCQINPNGNFSTTMQLHIVNLNQNAEHLFTAQSTFADPCGGVSLSGNGGIVASGLRGSRSCRSVTWCVVGGLARG